MDMERTVEGNVVAYKAEDGTVYAITAINTVAGILGTSQIPVNPQKDLDFIWEDSGVQKLIVFVPADAEEHKTAIRAAGFTQECRLKKSTEEGDLLLFGQYRQS